jgi:hypothetical protein
MSVFFMFDYLFLPKENNRLSSVLGLVLAFKVTTVVLLLFVDDFHPLWMRKGYLPNYASLRGAGDLLRKGIPLCPIDPVSGHF